MKRSSSIRLPEIDILRGLAIVLMILFHGTFDLQHFGNLNLNFPSSYWTIMPELIGSLFFSLVGLSAWLKYKSNPNSFKISLHKRGIFLLAVALGISVSTYWFSPETTVYFGALHCIGLSLLLLPFFANHFRWAWLWGIIFIFLGLILWQFKVSFLYLIWLGIAPFSGTGGDWFSLFPYLGVVLIGFWLGQFLYPLHKPIHHFLSQAITQRYLFRGLAFLGKHSLIIYVIHQPILIGILYQLKAPS